MVILQSASLKASPGKQRRALHDQLSLALSPDSQRKDNQWWSESHSPTYYKVSWGCGYRGPQSGWFKTRDFVSSSSGG